MKSHREDFGIILNSNPDANEKFNDTMPVHAVGRAAPVGAKLLLVEAMMPEQPIARWTTTLDVVSGRQGSMSEYVSVLNACGFRPEVRAVLLILSAASPPTRSHRFG
jgi:hypothetical protein